LTEPFAAGLIRIARRERDPHEQAEQERNDGRTSRSRHAYARCRALVAAAAEEICAALKRGDKALFCGNGGSAADSQHLAAELVVRFATTRIALPALALTTDTSALTAAANDLGVEQMFARQVAALGVKGDVVIGLTTSGNSPNVLAAFQEARRRGLRVV
jgi:D-sedoheptulose 7-phosphate isomerase